MADPRSEKKVIVGSSTTEVEFTDFEALAVLGTSGDLTLTDEDGNTCTWSEAQQFSIGGAGAKLSSYLKVAGTFSYMYYK